ncbi:MAG: sigma-70 family RNA polymerase sigma factor [Bacteroidales bacterium]|nr:sigma-70 family RNA polymerase sigma factor [Bacteroidales bacterium]
MLKHTNTCQKEFSKLIDNYQGIINKVSRAYFSNSEDRKDNFQEVVYQLWVSKDNLRDKSKIASWIYRVAINTSIVRLKKNSKIVYKENIFEKDMAYQDYEENNKEDRIEQLYAAINKLNEVERAIIILYLDEKSYSEISEICGISKSNVGIKIMRSKNKLKQLLKNI